MTLSSPTHRQAPALSPTAHYQPGICNIGPQEIARRRVAGHIGLGAAMASFAILVVIDAPPLTRLAVGLPAAAAASGYLQARQKFCAGFASRGVFNFGELGQTGQVVDEEARRRDRAKARQISLASLCIGIAVGLAAAAVPRR
jgi:hypothetical protein